MALEAMVTIKPVFCIKGPAGLQFGVSLSMLPATASIGNFSKI
jgi:hypothetical protein